MGIEHIRVLAPMAGITDGKFALKLIPYGFDTVTIGGYNVDWPTIAAGQKILKRGRKEFDISEENLIFTLKNEINLIKDSYSKIKVSANLRSNTPEPIINIINKVEKLDIVEINCHCRQEELLEIGCGQSKLYDLKKLKEFIETIADNQLKKQNKTKISVKIRANVENLDTLQIAKTIEESGADFIHIDAMKPGKAHADLEIIEKISKETEIFIIGNNSIIDVDSGKKMIDAGASGISIGRAAIGGKLNFDITKII